MFLGQVVAGKETRYQFRPKIVVIY